MFAFNKLKHVVVLALVTAALVGGTSLIMCSTSGVRLGVLPAETGDLRFARE